jgi:spore germination protein GerM
MRRRRLILAAVIGLAAVTLAACGDDKDGSSSTTSTTTTTTASSTTTASTEPSDTAPAGTKQTAIVYFVRDEKLGASSRTVTGPGVAKAALEALFAGPNRTESGLGMSSAVPDGVKVLGLTIAGGTATVDLNGAFQSGGGSLSMQLRVAQVVATLTQFDTVDSVDIHIDGQAVTGIGGEGIPATDLDRTDFEDVSPAILVEAPFPGATVRSPVKIAGTSNTFEATVLWSVLDGNGEVIETGHTTATSGTGTRGTFSLTADLGDYTGPATVKVFESSAKDGSEINVITIPVTVAA